MIQDSEKGTLYLGRIPHGFYEEEMKEYFSQFGDVTQLRLARNRKAGHLLLDDVLIHMNPADNFRPVLPVITPTSKWLPSRSLRLSPRR